MDNKIKWGVLGTASIAKGATIPGMKMDDTCILHAIAGRSKEKAESFKEEFGFEKAYYNYQDLIDDPEIQAVYIPLPNDLHYEWCMNAMKAGKNVLCEKPLAPTKKQAQELFDAAKKYGVVLMEAFAYIHSPYVDSLKSDLDSGIIGNVEYIESAFLVQGCKPGNIRLFKDKFGGAVYDLGCYSTSLMAWLLGNAPEKVQGIADYSEEGIDLFASAYLHFPGGIKGHLDCGMIFGNERDSRWDRLYIHGSKGDIISPVEFNQAGSLQYTIKVDGKETVRTVEAKQNYMLEVSQLGRCITNNEKPRVTEEFSVLNAQIIDMILESIGY